MKEHFEEFLESSFGLEVWADKKNIFRSEKRGIKGLVDFIQKCDRGFKNLIIFDKIVGRGVALLAVYLKAEAVYGKIGSESAVIIFKEFKIKFYFKKTVLSILNNNKDNLCLIEKLSLNKKPEEFFDLIKKS